MGDRRIAQYRGYIGYRHSFLVKKKLGMLHFLLQVEIVNSLCKYFLKSFFEVAFINSYFLTQFFYRNKRIYIL